MDFQTQTVWTGPGLTGTKCVSSTVQNLIELQGFPENTINKLFEPAVMSIFNELPSSATHIDQRAITHAAYGVYKNMEIPYHKITQVTTDLMSEDMTHNFKGVCAISEIRHTVNRSKEYQLYIRKYSKTPLNRALTVLENRGNMVRYQYSRFQELFDDPNYIESLVTAVSEVRDKWNLMYKHHKPSKDLLLKIAQNEYSFKLSEIISGPYTFKKDTLGLAFIEDTWMPFLFTNHHVYVKRTGEWELKYDILEPVTYTLILKP